MIIIVTGGGGFIGSNFIFYMLESHPNYRVGCLDKLTYEGNLSTISAVINKPNFRFVQKNEKFVEQNGRVAEPADELRHKVPAICAGLV